MAYLKEAKIFCGMAFNGQFSNFLAQIASTYDKDVLNAPGIPGFNQWNESVKKIFR